MRCQSTLWLTKYNDQYSQEYYAIILQKLKNTAKKIYKFILVKTQTLSERQQADTCHMQAPCLSLRKCNFISHNIWEENMEWKMLVWQEKEI